jgi:anti-sigma factor RsiW
MIDETYPAADSQLLAYVDGALAPSEREALEVRLAGDPALKAHLAELASGGRPFTEAYDALLRNAPRERLAASLDRARAAFEAARTERRGLATRRWLRPLAAALVVFLAGGAVGLSLAHLLPNGQIAADEAATKPDGWRTVVAEYLTLYTRDTLANLPDDRSLREAELKSVGDKLALGLSVDKVALDGLDLKRSQLFDLDGRPLAQIAYLTPDDGPVAFCIIADGEGDRQLGFEERQGKNIVYWSKGGHAFMLIGNLSRTTLETLAASLAARVA